MCMLHCTYSGAIGVCACVCVCVCVCVCSVCVCAVCSWCKGKRRVSQ